MGPDAMVFVFLNEFETITYLLHKVGQRGGGAGAGGQVEILTMPA